MLVSVSANPVVAGWFIEKCERPGVMTPKQWKKVPVRSVEAQKCGPGSPPKPVLVLVKREDRVDPALKPLRGNQHQSRQVLSVHRADRRGRFSPRVEVIIEKLEHFRDLGAEWQFIRKGRFMRPERPGTPQSVVDDAVHSRSPHGVDRKRRRSHRVWFDFALRGRILVCSEPLDDPPHVVAQLERDSVASHAGPQQIGDLLAGPPPVRIEVHRVHAAAPDRRIRLVEYPGAETEDVLPRELTAARHGSREARK